MQYSDFFGSVSQASALLAPEEFQAYIQLHFISAFLPGGPIPVLDQLR